MGTCYSALLAGGREATSHPLLIGPIAVFKLSKPVVTKVIFSLYVCDATNWMMCCCVLAKVLVLRLAMYALQVVEIPSVPVDVLLTQYLYKCPNSCGVCCAIQ
jgi:hypothetical protein